MDILSQCSKSGSFYFLTHWGLVTKYGLIDLVQHRSGNGFLSIWCQAITLTNVHLSTIGPQGTNFNEIWTKVRSFSFKKIHLKMSSAKCLPFCSGLNVLTMMFHFLHLLIPSPSFILIFILIFTSLIDITFVHSNFCRTRCLLLQVHQIMSSKLTGDPLTEIHTT